MIKFTILLSRKSTLTHAQFVEHHKTVHVALFMSVGVVKETVRRYVQHHSIPVELPGMPPVKYDGIAELVFDDVDALARCFSNTEYRRALDRTRRRSWICMPATSSSRRKMSWSPNTSPSAGNRLLIVHGRRGWPNGRTLEVDGWRFDKHGRRLARRHPAVSRRSRPPDQMGFMFMPMDLMAAVLAGPLEKLDSVDGCDILESVIASWEPIAETAKCRGAAHPAVPRLVAEPRLGT